MKRLQKAAVLTRLIDELRRHKSWAGETHVQKAGYLLQEVTGVPLGYDFVLYHYGPFSFDLRDELTALRADGLVTLEPHLRYGPKLATTPQAEKLQKNFERTLARYSPAIKFVARKLGSRGVYDLEKLTMALYATKKLGESAPVAERAKMASDMDSSITYGDAVDSVRKCDMLVADWLRGAVSGGATMNNENDLLRELGDIVEQIEEAASLLRRLTSNGCPPKKEEIDGIAGYLESISRNLRSLTV